MQALSINGGVSAPIGFYADGIHCGLKADGKLDLAFVRSENPCECAAVFTANRFAAAPVLDAKKRVANKVQAIVINTKHANAMTGKAGEEAVRRVTAAVPFENPISCSTGVIGAAFPTEKVLAGIAKFDWNAKNAANAAEAIKTTDRWAKEIAFLVETDRGSFKIGAMAKGAGMIAPQLATMLCFVTTDAALNRAALQRSLDAALHTTFNAISVDGDMSTNDSVFVLANGASGVADEAAFAWSLEKALKFLALEIVRDGEGASKVAAFEVRGAASAEDAKIAAKALSRSLLVKTALFGSDPNWGRLASTIGAAQVECDPLKLTIKIGDVAVYSKGENLMTSEVEAKAAAVLCGDSFKIACDLGVGEGEFTAYGCDLGHEYVKINADYRS
ncbi:MAG: bifunctional glutamate N-acetyltransferase/amino-acid acetyltransferase ArgJ [Helicobacteraceae bacterium]|jgi:glutamate N-acetyltransferase/amino-acid N-acetyltransferase|nr:bifunctional glutamate N-acetyltransferase/amino-acid acetyltransferase ArgJ [Helicobacteraceae bacterium]